MYCTVCRLLMDPFTANEFQCPHSDSFWGLCFILNHPYYSSLQLSASPAATIMTQILKALRYQIMQIIFSVWRKIQSVYPTDNLFGFWIAQI